ncbi:MAG: SDR family NAD(P)-dependent oxidoreductase [Actinomycetota bacterium]|nr:SDR family NAD(P)-dependent oxidoreductase [Actinomycetota bacterium]
MSVPIALVTGAGGGLGSSVCRRLHELGYTVVATDRAPDLLAEFRDAPGYVAMTLDVTDTASAQAVAAAIDAQFGRLDLVISNAGMIGYFPVVEMDPDEIVRHFQVNTFGTLRVVHACLGLLVATGGRVVTISSESYRFRNPFQIYQSTKLALEGLCDVLRRELRPLGVQLTTVRPGAIDTELFRAMREITNPVAPSRLNRPFIRFATALERRPPGRVSSPDEVAAVVVRAASARRMKPHYEINNMRALRIAGALPPAVADRLVARMLRSAG